MGFLGLYMHKILWFAWDHVGEKVYDIPDQVKGNGARQKATCFFGCFWCYGEKIFVT
jgi:hypothetical protein